MPIYMNIEGIVGEVTAKGYEGSIELDSFSWGLNQAGTGAVGGGGGAGKVSFQDLHFEASSSKASPQLAKSCATGQHLQKATLSAIKGERGGEYYTIKMNDVLISSYQAAGAGDEGPEESVSLNFAKIEFDYKPQKADGSLDEPVVFSFDLLANRTG